MRAAAAHISGPFIRPDVRRGVAFSYANRIVGIAAPLILIPLYVRFLGQELYGEWLIILSIVSYLGLAHLGSAQALGNRVAEAAARGRWERVGRLASTGFVAYVAMASLLVMAMVLAAPFVAAKLLPAAMTSVMPAFYVYFMLVAIAFPFRASAVTLRGVGRVDLEQTVDVCANVARVVAVGAVLVVGWRLVGVAVAQGVAMLIGGVATYALCVRRYPQARIRRLRVSLSTVRELAAPSLGFFGLTLASTLCFGVDNLVIGYAMGGRAVTRYAVALSVVTMAGGLFSVGVAALWPMLTAGHERGELARLRRLFYLLTRLAIMYCAVATVMLWLVGPWFLRLWAGPGVFPGRTTFGVQLVFIGVQILLTPADAILMATTRHYGYAVVAFIEAALNLGLSIWWVGPLGLTGVIAATLVARLVTNGWYLPLVAARVLEVNRTEVLRRLTPAGVVASAAAGVCAVVASGLVGASPLVLITVAGILVAGFLLAFGRFAFTDGERQAGIQWVGWKRDLIR